MQPRKAKGKLSGLPLSFLPKMRDDGLLPLALSPGLSLRHNGKGYVAVNENYQTAVSHIYAAGDVIGFPALASISMEQARVAICHAFGFDYKQRVASLFPLGIYTIPEVSAVGETEETCIPKKIDYCVGRAHYENNARGQIIGDTTGMHPSSVTSPVPKPNNSTLASQRSAFFQD